ncbi:MAG: N-succinylarginine dihydrolase [Deferrisomatales bacterium]
MTARRPPGAAREVNFDGIVGPTHSYAGLSYGNLASMTHRGAVANPRAAALQGLRKMKLLADLGLVQGVLPPQERPHVETLRALGFAGTDAQVLARAAREAPKLLAACSSASSMWAANAATVCPSADSADGRVHFTPANLVTQFHRSLEAPVTARLLQTIFSDPTRFAHHPPLPAGLLFSDEGAANHMRLCPAHGSPGVQVFVYGRSGFGGGAAGPAVFPARQTLEAAQALARRHGLAPDAAVCLRQRPEAIDAGVFHNDVVAVANEDVLFCHEEAYAEPDALERLAEVFQARTGRPLTVLRVEGRRVPLPAAVASYLFNSQLVSLPGGGMALIAPAECLEDGAVREVIEELVAGDSPLRQVHYVDVRQSMQNGGGPACLRLRVVLTPEELGAVGPRVLLDEALYAELVDWVGRRYRDRLTPSELADPQLLEESRAALDELTTVLGLGSMYEFQRGGA